ncbi:MAG TPA: ATP-binding protein, partial [Mycobacterium sp.]|nr:ATP-binding protein [Mycobacterium sp.]
IRYTLRGEINVQCLAPDDGSLRLAVSDTGIGIPNDEISKIFEDFRRLDEGRRTYRDGFGLGLGIVRRLAALLELSVSVRSTVGRGSTFEVTIPPSRVHPA